MHHEPSCSSYFRLEGYCKFLVTDVQEHDCIGRQSLAGSWTTYLKWLTNILRHLQPDEHRIFLTAFTFDLWFLHAYTNYKNVSNNSVYTQNKIFKTVLRYGHPFSSTCLQSINNIKDTNQSCHKLLHSGKYCDRAIPLKGWGYVVSVCTLGARLRSIITQPVLEQEDSILTILLFLEGLISPCFLNLFLFFS